MITGVNIMDVLTDMARTGGLGVLKPGTSLDEVSGVLGAPAVADYVPDAEPSWPRTFAYGDVRLEVCRCGLIHRVALSTWTESVRIPATCAGARTDTVTGTAGMSPTATFAQLRAALDLARVAWESDLELASQFSIVVDRAPILVRFTFATDAGAGAADRSDGTLHSAIARDTEHMCP
ncbi:MULTISPECIES: hypothetical protein [unclassified Streptomyces]|uniref:hypothetical protein n=1 Tax=unclassified Streptomyces TaxID=2593676 RepID=UPI003320D012